MAAQDRRRLYMRADGCYGTSMWMTRKEVADYLEVSVDTVDRWARAGLLIAYKTKVPGGRKNIVRFRRSDVERFFYGTE